MLLRDSQQKSEVKVTKANKPVTYYKIWDIKEQKYVCSADVKQIDETRYGSFYNRKFMWKQRGQPFAVISKAVPDLYQVHSYVLSFSKIESPDEYLEAKKKRDEKKAEEELKWKRESLLRKQKELSEELKKTEKELKNND
jgi:hypothetical protein